MTEQAAREQDLTDEVPDTPSPDGRDLGDQTWSDVRFDIVLAPADAPA